MPLHNLSFFVINMNTIHVSCSTLRLSFSVSGALFFSFHADIAVELHLWLDSLMRCDYRSISCFHEETIEVIMLQRYFITQVVFKNKREDNLETRICFIFIKHSSIDTPKNNFETRLHWQQNILITLLLSGCLICQHRLKN